MPVGIRQPPGPNRRPNTQGEIATRPDNRTFDDDRDRQICAARRTTLPSSFPVEYRWYAATRRMRVVAEIGPHLLLCDDAHEGQHRWPEGAAPVDESFPVNEPNSADPADVDESTRR